MKIIAKNYPGNIIGHCNYTLLKAFVKRILPKQPAVEDCKNVSKKYRN
jgi:hypothetical protein